MTELFSIANAQKYIDNQDVRRAIFELTGCIKSDPNDFEAILLRADCYLHKKLYREAILDYDAAFSNPDLLTTLNIIYNYCLALYGSGDYTKAINQLQTILDSTDTFTEANLMMGELMMLTSNFEKAILFFSKVVEVKSNEYGPYFMRAQCYYKMNKFIEAIIDYQKTLSLYEHHEVHLHFGICLYNSGRKQAGIYEIESARKSGNVEAEKYLELLKTI